MFPLATWGRLCASCEAGTRPTDTATALFCHFQTLPYVFCSSGTQQRTLARICNPDQHKGLLNACSLLIQTFSAFALKWKRIYSETELLTKLYSESFYLTLQRKHTLLTSASCLRKLHPVGV